MRLLVNIEENKMKNKLFSRGLKAFNNKKYYDAHEYWEDLWTDYRLEDAEFIQGLIQLSVGYFHITNLNINGAKGLFGKCLPKLKLYREGCRGVNVNLLIDAVDETLKNLNSIDDIEDFNWKLAPIIDD